MHTHRFSKKARRTVVLVLIVLIGVGSASAGLLISRTDGMLLTSTDRITFVSSDGFRATSVDGLLALDPNKITAPTTSGILATNMDGVTPSGSNSISAASLDNLTIAKASGVTLTSLAGLVISSADGSSHLADSVFIEGAKEITATTLGNLKLVGLGGAAAPSPDSRNFAQADGLTAANLDSLMINSVDGGIRAISLDGQPFIIPSGALIINSIDGLAAANLDIITLGNPVGIAVSGLDDPHKPLPPLSGLLSVDPALAATLDNLLDDTGVGAFVVYHRMPTDEDIDDLRQKIGILLGQRYHALPMVSVVASKAQLMQISRLSGVRSIYGNRTLKLSGEPGNGWTGTEAVKADAELTARNGGQPFTGRNVTVAVLDTGIGLHGDFGGRVKKHVKLVGLPGLGLSFSYPISIEGVPLDLSGHGTFVAGVVAGDGASSGGKYKGVAPGADLVGLSVGDLALTGVMEGFDYILKHGPELGVRVVNCSFSAAVLYDPNDPVNIATKMLTDRGVNVVFSAGNTGPGMDTLNPYAMAPWVISVGATGEDGRLAGFSSRGSFTKLSGPTLVAPGVNVVGPRAIVLGLTGVLNLVLGPDLSRLSLTELPFYTVSSGTSFSAPQVAGTIALMLEANPNLTPAEVHDILQRTATPMPPYYRHEVGAGMLNAHAAVLEAAFPERRMGTFRASLDHGQARFVNDPLKIFTGSVKAGATHTSNITIPQNSVLASVQIAWGPELSTHDLALQLTSPSGQTRPEVNGLNLPILAGRRERDMITSPAGGVWRAKVRNTLSLLGLLSILSPPQPFVGAVETTSAEYPYLSDIQPLSAPEQSAVYQNLRSFVMAPNGSRFRPQFPISRYDLASALVIGGRVPQYLAGQPRFTDVTGHATRIMVESVQASPTGPLFHDAAPGGTFRPGDPATRLTAAIALVRAAGRESEAASKHGATLPVGDAGSIPPSSRGYVWVALNRGLMTANGGAFRPNDAMKRIELAQAMVGLAKLATQ